jgi:hypothetical protein
MRGPFLGVMHLGHEADHSFGFSGKVKNAWRCTATPPSIFKAWCKDSLAFTSMMDHLLLQGNMQTLFTENIVVGFEVIKLKLKLNYDSQSVGQSVLVSGIHLGLPTNFSFSMKLSLDICKFIL